MRITPWNSLGLCRRVTNKGESGFGKASDRLKSEDHCPYWILSEVWWGALSVEGRKLDRCSKIITSRVPNLYPKRCSQALRPNPPISP